MSRSPVKRDVVEALIVSDVQSLSAESDDLSRVFCARHDLTDNDFRALLHVMVSERDGEPLTQSQLGQRIGVSGAAITYLVDRMVQAGHRPGNRIRPTGARSCCATPTTATRSPVRSSARWPSTPRPRSRSSRRPSWRRPTGC